MAGTFFYLYLIVDIFSRKIVGWEVHDRETAELAAQVLERAIWAEKCLTGPLVLHADNGSPMKGATMKATMERLGVIASFSRPRVSNDNPFSRGFATIEDARTWVQGFAHWYNLDHRQSALRFVTPDERHCGKDKVLLANQHQVYQLARAARPERWLGKTRNWQPVGPVWLNPDHPNARPKTKSGDNRFDKHRKLRLAAVGGLYLGLTAPNAGCVTMANRVQHACFLRQGAEAKPKQLCRKETVLHSRLLQRPVLMIAVNPLFHGK